MPGTRTRHGRKGSADSGASRADARVVTGVLARNGVVAPPVGHVAATLAAPTLLEHGTASQVEALVRPIATGAAAWCQLFSEPGSGSDLASIGARAIRDGDEWIVTGQKVWNSGADTADFGMLLARTDVDVPKHRGVTYFVVDMHQPGIDARPLRQMNGMSSFCEVFLTEARIPAGQVVGEVNGGWQVAQTTLFHERNSVAGGGTPGLFPARSGSAGDLDSTVGEIIERARAITKERRSSIRSGAIPAKVMIELAQQYGVADDAALRQELARLRVPDARRTVGPLQRLRPQAVDLQAPTDRLPSSRRRESARTHAISPIASSAQTVCLTGRESPLGGDLQTVGLGEPRNAHRRRHRRDPTQCARRTRT